VAGRRLELRPAGQRPRSSFHESLPPTWGLHEYGLATGATWAQAAAARAAELFLSHRLFLSLSDGEVIDRRWLALHYPPYWHYEVLQALLILSRLGRARDPRAADALELLMRRRRADGRWQPGGSWWRPPGSRTGLGPVEVVDWGAVRRQRDAHPQCAAGAQGRWLIGTSPAGRRARRGAALGRSNDCGR
jgi:hypothetical protein